MLILGTGKDGSTEEYLKEKIVNTTAPSKWKENIIVFDTSKKLLNATKDCIQEAGYKIKEILVGKNSGESNYNPFQIIKTERDMRDFLDSFMEASMEEKEKTADPFWQMGEKILLSYCIATLLAEGETVTFQTLSEKIMSFNFGLNTSDRQVVDSYWGKVASEYETHFKKSPEQVRKSIIISAILRINRFVPSDSESGKPNGYINFKEAILDEQSAIFISFEDCDYARVIIRLLVDEIRSVLLETESKKPFSTFIYDTKGFDWLAETSCRIPCVKMYTPVFSFVYAMLQVNNLTDIPPFIKHFDTIVDNGIPGLPKTVIQRMGKDFIGMKEL